MDRKTLKIALDRPLVTTLSLAYCYFGRKDGNHIPIGYDEKDHANHASGWASTW